MSVPNTEPYARTSTGVELLWTKYAPNGDGPWPCAIVLHPGGFKAGPANNPQIANICEDLRAAGFLALATEYRLAPPHLPMNYPNHPQPAQNTVVPPDEGHYPKQTDDCRMALRTIRGRTAECNGTVVMVGGSTGASHTLYCTTRGRAGDSAPDAAVAFSPPCFFDDPEHLKISYAGDEANMHAVLMNYLGREDTFPNYSAEDMKALHDAAPVSYVKPGMSPIFAIVSSDDTSGIDTYDFPALIAAFKAKGMAETAVATRGAYRQMIVPVVKETHAFAIWTRPYDGILGHDSAGKVAIDWLKGFLAE